MGEGIAAHNRLIGLHIKTRNGRQQTAGLQDILRHNPIRNRDRIRPRAQRHHHFFDRGIARAFANAIDGGFNLPHPGTNGRKRIRNRQTQIIMIMRGQDHLIRTRDPFTHHGENARHILRQRITDRIGDIDGGGTRLDGRFHTTAEEIRVRPRAIFRRPFHIIRMLAGEFNTAGHQIQHLFRFKPQLDTHMQRTGRDKSMYPLARRRLHRLSRPQNISRRRARQATNHRPILGKTLRNGQHTFKIPGRGNGEARFHHINPQFRQRFRHAELFLKIHGKTGRLFTIAERGVEHDDAVIGELAERRMRYGHDRVFPGQSMGCVVK